MGTLKSKHLDTVVGLLFGLIQTLLRVRNGKSGGEGERWGNSLPVEQSERTAFTN